MTPAWERIGLPAGEVAAVALLGVLVLAARDLRFLVRQPLWFDETWVAVSTRAPLGSLHRVTSATPLGWTFLLRLVPGDGQYLRVVPLVFAIAAAGAAWWFGRELLMPRFVAVLCGVAVAIAPALLVRIELKQYTAEAFFAVLMLVMIARLENQWSNRRLALMAGLIPFGMLFAHAIVFVGAATFGALALETTVTRRWRQLRDLCLAGAAAAVPAAVIYLVIDRPHVNPKVTAFWAAAFPPPHSGLSDLLEFARRQLQPIAPYLGTRNTTLLGLLMLLGVAILVSRKRYALAAVFPFTVLSVLAASAARKYPFGDQRTSTFMMAMAAVLIAVGVGGVLDILRRRVSPVVALVGFVAVLVVWFSAASPFFRSRVITPEDVRAQVQYVNEHRQPGDVVVVGMSAAWGHAFYNRELTPSFHYSDDLGMGFIPTHPDTPWLIELTGRTKADVQTALAQAREQVGPDGGRVWIIRSHLFPPEQRAWDEALAGTDTVPIPVGPDPLLVHRPWSARRVPTTPGS